MSTTELPSVLAFERKLEVSDGLMCAGVWGPGDAPDQNQKWEKIQIIPRYNRSTQSSAGIADDKKSQPNPVAASNDDANLPVSKDTLRVIFTLRVIGNLGKPFTCNDPDFEKNILLKMKAFTEGQNNEDQQNLEMLAKRYAYNIANGRFLWRNRVGAEEIKICVEIKGQEKVLVFNAKDFSLLDFDKNPEKEDLKTLTEEIKKGLLSKDDFIFIKVSAYVKLGENQHVFPSQEMNMGEKKKVLFQLDNCAAIHNVKIGNALRTVDNWYANAQFPIAAEPFGAVTQMGQAFRKSKNDLYTLMLKWINTDDLINNEKSFVVANIIRGGVFGKSGD